MRDRKISRRNFLRNAALTGGSLVLAACAQPTQAPTAKPEEVKPTEASKPTSPPPQAPVTISFWYYWGGLLGDTCHAVADDFMKSNPNIKVEANATDGWEKVLSAFAAGTPPDVLLDFGGPQLMARNQLIPLDDLIATTKDIKQDDYFPAWWNAFSWKGKQYGLPAGEAGVDMAMIINKGLAAEAGLDLKNPPQTIDEMLCHLW
jgi:ABC-type glycerol-3-phosphate transport system substrate-binding protein